jgi:predicted SAM-dependent methyltransferase
MLKSIQLRIRLIKANKDDLKIVVGSGGVYQEGWIPTGIETLDVKNKNNWKRFLKKESVNAILAEHIWEHLPPQEALKATKLCYEYLKPGGYCRIAVPDGHHPDPVYIEGVGPIGPNEEHKVLYTFETLKELFESCGFKVNLLEYHDKSKIFHNINWEPELGLINRSIRYRNTNKEISCLGLDNYTSLIIDAYKEV